MHSTDAAHCYIRPDVRCCMCTSVSVSVWRAHSWILQKRMNRSKCRLGEELTWAQGTIFQMGIHIGAVWQIWLNDPWAGAGDDVALCQITLNTWFCYSARNSAARATTTMTTAAPFDSRAFFLAPVRITAILRLSSVNLSYIWLSSDKTEESRTNTWRPSHVVCDCKLSRLHVISGFNCMLHIGVWAGGLQTPESGKIIFFRAIEQFFGQRPKMKYEK